MNQTKLAQIYKKENLIGLLYGFCIFLLCDPYFTWETRRLNIYVSIVIFVISLFYLRKLKTFDIVVIPLFLFSFIYLYHNVNLYGFINKAIFLTFILLKEKQILIFIDSFKKIFIVSLFLSLIIYILVVIFFVPVSYNIIPPLNSLKPNNYVQYPFLVSESYMGFKYLNIRFCGMFDEPGVVGSITTILLFADNYNLRKKQNIILFVAGIVSFSFYFIISSIVYFLYLSNNKIRLLFISLFFLLFLMTRNDVVVDYLVWDRFAIENGQIKGDNRSSEGLNATFNQFMNGDEVIWGEGADYTTNNNLLSESSYKLLILNYGMVFFIIICLSFSLFAYYIIKDLKYVIGYLFLFYGMMYQRPGLVMNPSLYFIMIACIYAIKQIAVNKTNFKT